MTHYPPQQHQDNNREHMIDVIKTYPLAMLVSVKETKPLISHLPLIYSEGKLIGHLDKFNPQAEVLKDNNEVTVIFSGPQCYISPSIYSTTQLPTWNYVMVHITGKVKEITDPEVIKASMIDMTSFLEAPAHRYTLEPDNPRMAQFISYVRGFEIDIEHWEGKFKLSQDKKPSDIENARNELIRANQESIKAFLARVF
ncbi:PaiB family negative transcriptional regulator [Gelidibacter algens]|jgi:transcriptional regulator|uniref:PaiB family negative transcriptional regulator n=1 Tax=Gelidibacter algens TaxID=49280 RepID=A0A1A7QXE3_9FLAO|nr:FMN-binding negative transcriptional regulator [Gelidibacter algens]OBX24680.1 transcriptional regulator [Gelidibacter algens]RAJ20845.1 PaiB family negative transcriptional regulator [Gelidibacter algens]